MEKPTKAEIYEMRLEDFIRDNFGLEIELSPQDEDGNYLPGGPQRVIQLLTLLGVETASGCKSDWGQPCPAETRFEEGDYVFVPANPYGYTPPFVGKVVAVIENYGGKTVYRVLDIKRNGVDDLIPCACALRPLKDLGVILKEPIKAYWE